MKQQTIKTATANQAPCVLVLLGAEGIKQAYESTLDSKTMDIKCLSTNYADVLGTYFDEDYWPRVLNSNIQTREVILNTESGREYANGLTSKGAVSRTEGVSAKNKVAFVEKQFQSETDMIVLEQAVILISFNTSAPYALIIEDDETVKSMKQQFELLWKNADK